MQNQQLTETPARNVSFLAEGTKVISVTYSNITLSEKKLHKNAQIKKQALIQGHALQTVWYIKYSHQSSTIDSHSL